MKIAFVFPIILLICSINIIGKQTIQTDLNVLVGEWKIDMSPEDVSDNNFAQMIITSIGKNSIEGFFYRDGVKIKEGRITISKGIIYAALQSSDKSGTYNTSFYHKDGVLYGTTHSLTRDFLAVWEAIKITK